MKLKLDEQAFIVTGGSSGIGLATARLLLAEGASVTICGRDQGKLSGAVAELDSPMVRAVRADVLDEREAKELVAAAVEQWGRLDGVAAIAGRGRHGTLLTMDVAEAVLEVSDKLAGLLHIVRPAVPFLVASSGRVVGLTAPSAASPDVAMAAVSAGRSALDSAIRSLAVELASSGVRCNAVGVGLIDTPRQRRRHAESASDAAYDQWLMDETNSRNVPLKRAGRVEEVAAAICWLLSPVSSYTTGAVIDVTGGLPCR